MCVWGGYGGMTLTNTTLKHDPSTTNPAMMSSRGRKQLTLVDNKTIHYVSAGAACSETWREREREGNEKSVNEKRGRLEKVRAAAEERIIEASASRR